MRSRRRRRWVARSARSQSLRGSVRQARVPIVFENCSSRFADPREAVRAFYRHEHAQNPQNAPGHSGHRRRPHRGPHGATEPGPGRRSGRCYSGGHDQADDCVRIVGGPDVRRVSGARRERPGASRDVRPRWRLDERQQGLGERSVHVGLLPVRGVRVRVAAAPNAPAFLLPHVQRPGGIAQANELAAALQAAGTSAEEASFPGTGLAGHAEINRRLGDLSYAETPVVDAWLAKVFA